MTRYIKAPAAIAMSEHLWDLVRPPGAGQGETQYLFPWRTLLDGSVWLAVEDDYRINIHPQAEIDGIADILQPYIDAGEIPADTNTNLAAFIISVRGQEIVAYDAFPQFFKDASKTRAELAELGLINSETFSIK